MPHFDPPTRDSNVFPKASMMLSIAISIVVRIPQSSTLTLNSTETDLDYSYAIPGLSHEAYIHHGDINIGAIVSVRRSTGSFRGECSDKIGWPSRIISGTEEIAFAVDLVNRDPTLLPNLTLGFVAHDYCRSSKIAMATALTFLPRTRHECVDDVTCDEGSAYNHHDVIGVLAPTSSETNIPISTLYGMARLPLIGHVTTSDELSNKFLHPYFFRVVPPDKYTVQAMLKFIRTNGWSYISVLYSTGSFGENAFDSLKLSVDSYRICIATSHRVAYRTDYDDVMSDLLEHDRARVVVLFTNTHSFHKLLRVGVARNVTGHFIWLGAGPIGKYTGLWGTGPEVDGDPAVGAFTFEVSTTFMPEYYDFLGNQTLASTRNPWLRPLWESLFDCSFQNETCEETQNLLESNGVSLNEYVSLKVDSVLAFAHAAHNLLSDRCPGARGQEARACITGELLHQYLNNVNFTGYTGHVEFDSNQEVRGRYIISQFAYGYYKEPFVSNTTNTTDTERIWKRTIGVYDLITDSISYLNHTISWSHLDNVSRVIPWSGRSSVSADVPESVCSRPCLVFEYKIEKELPCCWECRKCRENERIVNENTSCETCPEFQWPDASTGYRTCSDIALTYPKPSHLLPIILICLAIVVIIVTVLIFIGYVIYRNERVVKAGSRELSLLQLVAIFVGYVTVLVFQAKPTDETCGAIYFMFSMSFAWLYSPLLVKTIRIYRIFTNSTKHNRRPRYVSPHSQLVMALCLIAVQVLLCVVTYSMSKPTAHRNQPIWSEKLVELSCDLTLVGLASFLSYNLILVCLCSIFAFKTRKLPDNFNESKFISMCVSTTLVIWLAFIPTYFTADREVVRVLLLSTALLLNHSVALLFLFVPKMYAAIFLPPETPGTFNATTRFKTTFTLGTTISNRVSPAAHTTSG